MSLLPASNDYTSPAATQGDKKTFIAAVRVFVADLLGTDSSNKAAARIALGIGLFSGRNLLVDGNFRVNQSAYVSGTATVGANQYTLDLWRVVTSGQNLTYSASGNGNIATAPVGGLEQVVDGTTIGSAAAVINWVGTATCTVDGVAKTKGASVTLVPGTNAVVRFINGTVSQAQLELGSVATPFEFRPFGDELSMVKRYYEKSGTNPVWCGDVQNTGIYYYFVRMEPKRATPTVVTADVVTSAGFPAGAPSVGAISVDGFQVSKTCNGIGGARYYQFQWSADARF